jgi:Flp pilus assembly pilin Flp
MMDRLLSAFYSKLQTLASDESAQDLVEYALLVALVGFGTTAGMGSLASGINGVFNTVSTRLVTDISSYLLCIF